MDVYRTVHAIPLGQNNERVYLYITHYLNKKQHPSRGAVPKEVGYR